MRPNITILDLHLPDLGGLTVLSRIRAIDPQADRPWDGRGGDRGPDVGVDWFLTKGFSLFELDKALRLVMARTGKAPVRSETDGSRRH